MTRIATFFICDQVAQAGLGKLAFIGVYGAEIMVPQVPFELQHLFFVVRFRSSIDDPPKKLVVRIERPGEEPFIVDETAALSSAPETRPPDAKFFDAQAVIRLAPFIVRETGAIRVYVVDEITENYAGGVRITSGVHQELRIPQIVQGVVLAGGHYRRLANEPLPVRQAVATQLIEAMFSFADYSKFPLKLQYPEADVRLLLDDSRVHVFFPRPRNDDRYEIDIEPVIGAASLSTEIESKDRFGFIVRSSEPLVAGANVFNYEIREQETSGAGRPGENTTKPRGQKRSYRKVRRKT